MTEYQLNLEWQRKELLTWREDFLKRLPLKPTAQTAIEFQALRTATQYYLNCAVTAQGATNDK